MIPFPDKQYDVILADPPWQYQNYASDPGTTHDRARGAQKWYPTMTVEQLGELSLPSHDNTVLFMWATWPLIEDAISIINLWGFTYKTLAWEWIKLNRSGLGVFVGMGNYTRSNPEPCLLAFKGEPVSVQDHAVSSVIISPVRQHSRKPDEQYNKIERLYPDMSYIELFARRKWSDKWDVWGNEVT